MIKASAEGKQRSNNLKRKRKNSGTCAKYVQNLCARQVPMFPRRSNPICKYMKYIKLTMLRIHTHSILRKSFTVLCKLEYLIATVLIILLLYFYFFILFLTMLSFNRYFEYVLKYVLEYMYNLIVN